MKRTRRTKSAQNIRKSRKSLQSKFLKHVVETGTISHAAKAAGIDRKTVYMWRDSDENFAEALSQALDDSVDTLEREAIRRAAEGYLEPVIHQGRICGEWVDPMGQVVAPGTPGATFVPLTVRKYSDSLLLALLKAKRYADRTEVSGPNGAPLPSNTTNNTTINVHVLAPAALKAFHEDLTTAGLGHLSDDSSTKRLDTKITDATT